MLEKEQEGRESGPEDGDEEDGDEEDGDETDDDRHDRESSNASTITADLATRNTPINFSKIENKHHGTYATLVHANRAALSIFLQLAKPKNSRIEDNYFYKDQLESECLAKSEEGGYGQDMCRVPAVIEREVEKWTRYQWWFRGLTVEVVQSELKGPVEIGDMVVEVSGGDINGEEAGKSKEKRGERTEREVMNGAGTLPSPLEEEEIGEEEGRKIKKKVGHSVVSRSLVRREIEKLTLIKSITF